MSITSPEEVFIHDLGEILDAESQLALALPNISDISCKEELKAILKVDGEQTKTQLLRLERIFEIMGKSVVKTRSMGMEGLIREIEILIETEEPKVALDATIVTACQKIKNYEIVAYSSLIKYARLLEQEEAGELLQTSVAEEEQISQSLSSIESEIILMAAEEAGKLGR